MALVGSLQNTICMGRKVMEISIFFTYKQSRVQPIYVIILSTPNKNRYVFYEKMLLVKTSFLFAGIPYICDPFGGSQKLMELKKGKQVRNYDIKKTANSQ